MKTVLNIDTGNELWPTRLLFPNATGLDDQDDTINPDADEIGRRCRSNCDELSDFDRDGDGFVAEAYGGDDCNDTDETLTEYWILGLELKEMSILTWRFNCHQQLHPHRWRQLWRAEIALGDSEFSHQKMKS